MRDNSALPRRGEADVAEAGPDEAKVRQALERLGTRSSPGQGGADSRASGAPAVSRSAERPRKRFVRDGDVPVVRVPSPVRAQGEAGHGLAGERAARLRAEEALADAQAAIGRLQVARSRAEQALQAALAAVEERDAAVASLRADLVRAALREAELARAARADAEQEQARAKLAPATARTPEPVRWWLLPSGPRD